MVAEEITIRSLPVKRNIPATLREIASQIEEGKHGQIESVAIVVVGTGALDIRLCGKASSAGDAHMILHAGMLRLADSVGN